MKEREGSSGLATSPRSWAALRPALSEWMINAVSNLGFHRMTPVQASTIPLFMTHKDVVVEAVTGSGKTLAFLIPVIERLLRLEEPIKKHHVGAIIISPTRELAKQIHAVLISLISFHSPSASALGPKDAHESTRTLDLSPLDSSSSLRIVPQLLLGGSNTPAQDLSHFLTYSPNLLISTPGRLLELLTSPHVHCPQSSFEILVLDEADRLLDLGFKDDLRNILARLPKQRRTGLFSASVSEAVGEIVRVGLRNPVKVAVRVRGVSGGEDRRTPASLRMTYLITPPSNKLPALSCLLRALPSTPQKTIVFLSTCAAVDYFQHIIPATLSIHTSSTVSKFKLIPLHGKQPPQVRNKNFNSFVDSTGPSILLTTDIAARGLDIPQVDLVVQIDPPSDPKVFLHRCGRAGRAGRKGLSVVFLEPGNEEDYIPFLDVRKTPILPLQSPPVQITAEDAQRSTECIRKLILADRALHDKAQRAFVSWVQAYSKHQAGSIFRVTTLDWVALGQAWGLIRLPRMPELKAWEGDRSLGLGVDMAKYAYADKTRERVRRVAQQEYEERRAERPDHVAVPRRTKKSEPWSEKSSQRELREVRREKKEKRREAERVGKLTETEQEGERELQQLLALVRRQRQEAVADDDVDL